MSRHDIREQRVQLSVRMVCRVDNDGQVGYFFSSFFLKLKLSLSDNQNEQTRLFEHFFCFKKRSTANQTFILITGKPFC